MTLIGIALLLAGAFVSFAGRSTLIHLFLGVVLLGVGFVLMAVAGSRRPVWNHGTSGEGLGKAAHVHGQHRRSAGRSRSSRG